MQHTLNFRSLSMNLPRYTVAILPKSIKERIKRIIFVFSVLATLQDRKSVNRRMVQDINHRLRLAQGHQLCQASADIHSAIWSHLEEPGDDRKDVKLTPHSTRLERELVSEYYVRHCPDWLKYGSANGKDMARDLLRLFNALASRAQ